MRNAVFRFPGLICRISRCCAAAATFLLISQSSAGAETKSDHSPAPAQQQPALPEADRQNAVILSALTFPTPGEFFAALAKAGCPNLAAAGRVPVPVSLSERPRIALLVGVLLADGFLAAENQNGQDMKNIGRDLIELARKLNAGEHVISRGRSLTDFAENNDWNSLRQELDATRNEIRISLTAQKDMGLSLLVSLGSWLRALHAGSLVVKQNYSPDAAELFRQAELVDSWLKRASIQPQKFLESSWVAFVLERTKQLGELLRTPQDGSPPDAETIASVQEITSDVIRRLLETRPGEEPEINAPSGTPTAPSPETPAAETPP